MTERSLRIDLKFSALTVFRSNERVDLLMKEVTFDKLRENEIVIKVSYSSINFKDRLICQGNTGLVRRFPHVPGIDAVGHVTISNSPRFKVGDQVLVIATPLGVKCAGGLAEYTKIPDNWAMPIPENLTARDVAAFGTAGFTAALAISKLEQYETSNKNGPILITGAAGGVGLIAAFILLARGYEVELVSSDPNITTLFADQDRVSFVSYAEFLNQKSFPLLKSKYAGAIENVGGEALSIALRSLHNDSKLCAIGMAKSENLNVSVMPFILRGIHIVGINAESTDSLTREKIWRLIAEIRPHVPIEKISRECSLEEVCHHLMGSGGISGIGRMLVKI